MIMIVFDKVIELVRIGLYFQKRNTIMLLKITFLKKLNKMAVNNSYLLHVLKMMRVLLKQIKRILVVILNGSIPMKKR